MWHGVLGARFRQRSGRVLVHLRPIWVYGGGEKDWLDGMRRVRFPAAGHPPLRGSLGKPMVMGRSAPPTKRLDLV
jgi:hypothetical protein